MAKLKCLNCGTERYKFKMFYDKDGNYFCTPCWRNRNHSKLLKQIKKERHLEYRKTEHYKLYIKEYNKRDYVIAKQKERMKHYFSKPEVKAKAKIYSREYQKRDYVKAKRRLVYKKKGDKKMKYEQENDEDFSDLDIYDVLDEDQIEENERLKKLEALENDKKSMS